MIDEAALATLLLPFRSGGLTWAAPAAFLRARSGQALFDLPGFAEIVCVQSFKPDAEALAQAGLSVVAELDVEEHRFDLVLVLPPRQRDEARALFATAMRVVKDGGRVVAAAGNQSGARSHAADLAQLAGGVTTQSKHKCRVFWTEPVRRAQVDGELLASWEHGDAPRPILDGRFVSRPGVFAWDHIDVASALLADAWPATLAGRAADLGAGFGYLSKVLLQRCRAIAALDVYEAEHRALALARTNLAGEAQRVPIDFRWHDVARGLPDRYDVIVSNPPFHTSSGRDDPGLGRRFIAAAANALHPGGRFWLVANRHLPYEAVLDASFGSVRVAHERYGFKIIEAVRAGSKVRS